MAFYDNKHWLLSHIRNSFISSDDTGMCEMVMLGEDLPRKLSTASKYECYPGVDDSDGEDEDADVMGQSFDIQSDLDFGVHRTRSSTAQRLEKIEQERKQAARIKTVKWEWGPSNISAEERADLFQRKEIVRKKADTSTSTVKKHSLLSANLEKCPHLPHNPFLEYAKYDGNAQVGVATRKYGIFLTMIPLPQRNYPMTVVVLAAAKVSDLIGLICWKYSLEHEDHNLRDSVSYYGLYIAEEDGEVDWDFPCLEAKETIGKFGFGFLALVERTEKDKDPQEEESYPIFKDESDSIAANDHSAKIRAELTKENEDLLLMKGHMTAMEAPLYQSYRVYIINKVRTKSEINLGISGEKLEIDPIVQQKVSAKFWNRQKPVNYDMDSVVSCDLTETRSSNKAVFRLVYHNSASQSSEQASSLQSNSSATTFKHHDFEADSRTADTIIQKINHILELRSSVRRREYLAIREKKAHRRRSFHLPLGSK